MASFSSQKITFTGDGAVAISYKTLLDDPRSLEPSIEKAFGADPSCLGLIVVTDLPDDYPAKRERLLKLANQFASLPESTREKYVDAISSYSFGWSHGKEIMNGRPDTLKGSYYANPLLDDPQVSEEERLQYPWYHRNNIWPSKDEEGIDGFEDAFKDLGRFIFNVGCKLASACQSFASSYLMDNSTSLVSLLESSQTTKARLLHYFPPPTATNEPETEDSWCGTHLDNSMLTGLCSAMYLRHREGSPPLTVPPPSADSGLYIHTRGGEVKKVAIPKDALAFQTGEALEICTAGRLRATPHLVKAGKPTIDTGIVSRETFAVFMQPNVDKVLSEDDTFGSFSRKIFAKHYDGTTM
ncbi:hypothetical protein FRC03_007386 [Tulasnella sp. 419]|nr:hypothetical protein FRC03_007386 [Tulasnella sp. 419]